MTRRQFSFGARYYAICEQCLQLCHTSFLGAVRPAGNGFTLPNIVGTNTSFEGNSGSLDRQIEAGEDERFRKVTDRVSRGAVNRTEQAGDVPNSGAEFQDSRTLLA
jgi:hypothetical protein